MTPHDDGYDAPAKKPTGFLSFSRCILEEFSLRCGWSHVHPHLMSGRAAAAVLYPPALCRAICRGFSKQRACDNSGLAGGQRFGRKELESMTRTLGMINGDIEAIDLANGSKGSLGDDIGGEPSISLSIDDIDDNNDALTYGSQEASSHLTDEPGRGETHKAHQKDSRAWVDQKYEPDGTNPQHIDLNNVDNLFEEDCIREEVDGRFFKKTFFGCHGQDCHATGCN